MILIKKSLPIGGFLAHNDSDIFCRPKLIPIGRLDTELISHLHQTIFTHFPDCQSHIGLGLKISLIKGVASALSQASSANLEGCLS